MRPLVTAVALTAIVLSTGSAMAHPRKTNLPRITVTPAATVHPDVAVMIRRGVHPEVARMIVSSRNTTRDGTPLVPNVYMYEWMQALDTLSGIPPGVSRSSLANPWVDRTSPTVRRRAGLE